MQSVTASAATHLVLVRHGETSWHGENRYAGVSDIELTERGARQAVELGEWARAARPAAVVSSPLRRARATARPSAQVCGLDLLVVEDLREVDFGMAEGRTLGELSGIDHTMVERFRDDPATHFFPDGEQPAAAGGRAAAALRRLAADHPGATVLVVAHNTVLRLALCVLLGIDVSRYRDVFPGLDNVALTEVRLSGDRAALSRLNVPLPAAAPPGPAVHDHQPPSALPR